jgi:predicted transcriptional regulator
LSKDAPSSDLRAKAAAVISDRMRKAGISIPDIIKRSGLSENTVRDMAYGNKTKLASMAAARAAPSVATGR